MAETYTEYIEYTTKSGDRWDLIAYKCYGNAKLYEPIIKSNTAIPIKILSFPEGIKLKIPVINVVEESKESIKSPWD